ncbi:MAG: DUF2974 domain-containing protein [Solobacterium sp.]|nr:DUF2974 domain-containing protein [Solobacterium sp.]
MTMANCLDYLEWRGDLPFARDPINEVDLLIFSVLAYTAMDTLFGKDRQLTIPELTQRYVDAGIDQSSLPYNPKPLLLRAAECPRYANVLVSRYVNRVDETTHLQFSACTFQTGSKASVIAFRGTDNTVVGWHEDFNFSIKQETPAQRMAVLYLNQSIAEEIYVCGHSKGGNLAMYASSFVHDYVQKRIVRVTSFDGPGFQPEIMKEEGYQKILDRAFLILPESSVFGLLMNQMAARTIIRSTDIGISQHNPYTWKLKGNHFEKTNRLSAFSNYIDEVVDKWLESVSIEERKKFIDTVFTAIESTGVSTFQEMKKKKLETANAIFKALQKTDSEEVRMMADTLVKLASTGGNVIISDVMNFFGINRDKDEKKEDNKQPSEAETASESN